MSGAAAWLLALTGCVSYEPQPLDITAILADLDSVDWEPVPGGGGAAGPQELASFAVTHNPTLARSRGELGVARALLVEAGLLPDVEIGWDAMDVLASQIVDGTSNSVDVLSGLGVKVPLFAPGERSARVDAAEWRAEEALRHVAQAEWLLAREVYLAYEETLVASELFHQNAELFEVAEATAAYFARASEVGAATGIEASLALGGRLSIELDRVRLEGRLAASRQSLNALLGLPPGFELELGQSPASDASFDLDTDSLVERAVELRPDLARLMASYEASEREVELAVARQYPALWVGTGFGLQFGFLSRFGRPAIDTALARREELRREVVAKVHEVRRDVSNATLVHAQAGRELEVVEAQLLPNAEQNLRLAREALDAGEVTLLETLALQRSLVEARTQHAEVRAERAKSTWSLMFATGLLHSPSKPTQPRNE